MTHRTTRHLVFSNNNTNSSRRFSLHKLLRRRHLYTHSHSSFYLACQNNDLTHVEACLKRMTLEEINYQYPPNNETVLHIVTRKQYKEIIEILLMHGAQPSLKNTEGQQAYELAETEEINDLFKRSISSRFAFSNSNVNNTILAKNRINCKNCLLVNNNTMYEWELVDCNAAQKALKFRREFKAYATMNAKIWRRKFYSLKKGYFNAHPPDLSTVEGTIIHNCFERTLLEQNPNHLVTAYTSCQNFTTSLNIDMARNVLHDLKNGCSKFSCQCLYFTEDATKTISNIFLHHPKFQKLAFTGQVYRGILMPKCNLAHYQVGSCIITTTLLSTSKNLAVAEAFSDKSISDPSVHSFFCTYKIVSRNHTAIDISKLSRHPDEDEVLILPYSSFLITKIEEEQERTNIYLEEQCLTLMFDTNQSQIAQVKSH